MIRQIKICANPKIGWDCTLHRYSIAAGADLRPLFQFWGVYPDDEEALAKEIRKNDLNPSPAVHERLKHYRTLIPKNASEFKKHALLMYPRCEQPGRNLNEGDSLYGHGFYHEWLGIYEESHGEAALAALDRILERFFDAG